MIRILAVCTGNICRSPLVERVLSHRLADLDVVVTSAGTRARAGTPMTDQAIHLAAQRGVPDSAGTHAARLLTEADVLGADLIIALDRDHRRAVVELAPSGLRKTFTAREFARLAGTVRDQEFESVAPDRSRADDDTTEPMSEIVALIARQRGLAPPPLAPVDEDVVDPYGRSWATYLRSAEQLDPGLMALERVVRLVLS